MNRLWLFFLTLITFGQVLTLEGITLQELIKFQPGHPCVLVYRWSNQIALIEAKETGFHGLSLQMPLATYYKTPKPLKKELEEKGIRLSEHSAWQQLLSTSLEVHPNPGKWRPKLDVFKRLGIQVEWQVWKINLQKPLEENPDLRSFIVYTASGPDLDKLGLPQNAPYWIENRDTVHKWAMFLMDVESYYFESVTTLRETP